MIQPPPNNIIEFAWQWREWLGSLYDYLFVKTENNSTISDLISQTTKLDSVYVRGYHTAGDGGGGTFIWDADANKNTHNGGTIIDPDIVFPTDWTNQTQLATWFTAGSGTGVWRRVYDGDINIKWFGAKGDDTTDDSKPLQAAVDAGSVFIPDDTYYLTVGITVRSNITIRGNGWGSIIRTDKDIEVFNNDANTGTAALESLTIRDLYIKRQVTATPYTKYHIHLKTAVRNKILNVRITDNEHLPTIGNVSVGGVYFEEPGSVDSFVNWVDGCQFTHGSIRAVCSDSKFTNNYIWAHGVGFGIKLEASGNIISGNDVLSSPIEGGIVGTASAQDTTITGNNLDGSYDDVKSGVAIHLTKSYGSRVVGNNFYFTMREAVIFEDMLNGVCSNNNFNNGNRSNESATQTAIDCFALQINNASGYSTGAGTTMTVDATDQELYIGDVINFTSGGLFTLTANAAAGATSVTGDLTVAAVSDNEKGYKEYSDILLSNQTFSASTNIVSNNNHRIVDARVDNANAINDANHGSAPGKNNVTNNYVRSAQYNTPAIVRGNSTTLIRGNSGGGSESYVSGNSTITSGNNSVSVTHGCNYTITEENLRIIPTNTLVTADSWYVGISSATVFSVVTDVNVGSDWTFDWVIDIP